MYEGEKIFVTNHESGDNLGCFLSAQLINENVVLKTMYNREKLNRGLISSCKAPSKRTRHCRPTTPNIVGCYMLRTFAHPVVHCCVSLKAVAQSLKPVKLLSQ